MASILLTAGPTRAFLDDVRYLTNASSGRMAASIAQAAVAQGHTVTIVSGPVSVKYPRGVRVIPVVSTAEMLTATLRELPRVDGVIAAAAPCDFEPFKRAVGKIPRQGTSLSITLRPTVDVIATVARRAAENQWIVAFALEPSADPLRAFAKMKTKGCDLIVVNDLSAIDATQNTVAVYNKRRICLGAKSGTKRAVAGWLVRLLEKNLFDPSDRKKTAAKQTEC